MSRSTQPFKGFFSDGWHLVVIMETKQQVDGILITFADGNNNKFQELFKMDKCFIKMCGDAGLITDESVFDSEKSIGARLMIEIVERMLADTKEYNNEFQVLRPSIDDDTIRKWNPSSPNLPENKQKIIAEQRAMIKKVESGKSNEFDM